MIVGTGNPQHMTDDDDILHYNLDHGHPWHRALSRELSRAMRKPVEKGMKRMERMWPELASAVMDFILDVVDSPSFWGGYESWNLRHFGVALPITEGEPGVGLTRTRLHHFIWKLLNIVAEDFSLPPRHPDVSTVTDTIEEFWEKRKNRFTPFSDSSALLAGPIRHGWQAKDRLVILGKTSYFFRAAFAAYIRPHFNSATVINAIDDFLCQSCSQWSGMGAIDLLAETLDVPEARRDDIRSWSERHAAPYRIDSLKPGYMLVTNMATSVEYRVDWDEGASPIPVGTIAFGSLAKWDGGWRWSGMQSLIGDDESDPDVVKEFVGGMRKTAGSVLCRYWPEYRAQVLATFGIMYKSELEFYGGSDLVYFKTGKEFAASTSRFLNEYRDQRLQTLDEMPAEIPHFEPESVLSDDFLYADNGVALFLNPDEGDEMMLTYDDLTSGLRKKGEGLTASEYAALRGFIESPAISSAFVRRVLRDEPEESFKKAFGLDADAPAYWLDWLLRCWKGEFYRPRYPSVSVL